MYSAKLRISELQKDDEGQTYFLTVENDVGSINLTITAPDFGKGLSSLTLLLCSLIYEIFIDYNLILSVLILGLETAAIAGIVAGVVVVILVAAVIGYVVMKKKKKSKSPVTPINSGVSTIPNVGRVNPTPVTDSENPPTV